MKSLPPGFRFHPTDEELILHYLRKRLTSTPLPVSIIAEVDIYKFDPWDLPAKAEFGEKEWYFFSPRDRKYPNGARPNRAAASGYWKATGTDKTIVSAGLVVGVKKALVFYKGRPPKGVKTNWIMHEYRLSDHPYSSNIAKPIIINHNNNSSSSSMRLDDWVLCRIYKKTNAVHPIAIEPSDHEEEEPFPQETFKPQKSCSFSNLLDAMDYSILSSLLSDSFDHSIPGSATGSGCSDPPFFDTCPTSSNNNNNNNNYYIMQKVPQTQLSAQTSTENRLKRQLPDDQQQYLLSPPKKYASPCSFVSSAIQPDIPQNNIMNQLFLNQQLFLSPEL